MTENDEIFIKVLEYGAERGLEASTLPELVGWATEQGFIGSAETYDYSAKFTALRTLFEECFDETDSSKSPKPRILKNEYYFRLIEYHELQEARKAARDANRNAFCAIGLSIFTLLFSGFLTYTQLKNPVSISKADMQSLIDSNANPQIKTVQLNQNQLDELKGIKIDSLQMAQILSAIESSHAKLTIRKSTVNNPSNDSSMLEAINQYYEED